MTHDEIVALIESMKHKPRPDQYHYICSGGSTAGPMIDKWGASPEFICNSAKPDGGWINAPRCRKCDGVVKGVVELHQWEEAENHTLDAVLRAIRIAAPERASEAKGSVGGGA